MDNLYDEVVAMNKESSAVARMTKKGKGKQHAVMVGEYSKVVDVSRKIRHM